MLTTNAKTCCKSRAAHRISTWRTPIVCSPIKQLVPAGVFTRPQIASIGLTEDEARSQLGTEKITVKVQAYGDTAYGWAMEDSEGLVKLIANRSTGHLLGAHIMGSEATNLLQPLITAMAFDITAHRLARGQYWIHPAMAEVVENALLGLDVPESSNL